MSLGTRRHHINQLPGQAKNTSDATNGDSVGPIGSKYIGDYKELILDMRSQKYDVIRFATYRTACKMRFIQKKTNLDLVDLWNVIEACRQSTLNTMDHNAEISATRVANILNTVFIQLNQRQPANCQIDVERSVKLVQSWISHCYDCDSKGKVRVLAIKVCLSTLCSGKLVDKLRYIFMQISDANGVMIRSKFDDYLKHVLSLPTAVYEGPSFGYTETTSRTCFDGKIKVNVNGFLDTLLSEPGPKCLLWLPIMQRMAQIENVFHPIHCEGCHRESFLGFRYKCQRCHNYNLCQDCFWRGRTSGSHDVNHSMKEYTSYKSPVQQISHSLKKSFKCAPIQSNQQLPKFPDSPEKTIDLTNIVPSTPVPEHTGFQHHTLSSNGSFNLSDTMSSIPSPNKTSSSINPEVCHIDDEHRLIARYAASLAAQAHTERSPSELSLILQTTANQSQLISQLEAKNREILAEIESLRREQEAQADAASASVESEQNPTLLSELRGLRQRKEELEGRMSNLQESRRDLMVQLENLMKLLKIQGSPKSSPVSTLQSVSSSSPVRSARGSSPCTPGDSLTGVGGDVKQAFNDSPGNNVQSLQNDLLVAADSVTNAMSSLVKELNFDELDELDSPATGSDVEIEKWQKEVETRLGQDTAFIAQLHSRKHSAIDDDTSRQSNMNVDAEKADDDAEHLEMYDNNPKELTSSQYEDGYQQNSDAESYIKTDDEEGSNTDWEESMKRWVNR